jgi:hypothetical protein
LQQPHAAVLKREGGETEHNPTWNAWCSVHNGELIDENWPALFRRNVKSEVIPGNWL